LLQGPSPRHSPYRVAGRDRADFGEASVPQLFSLDENRPT
jgi:hypothetical protein